MTTIDSFLHTLFTRTTSLMTTTPTTIILISFFLPILLLIFLFSYHPTNKYSSHPSIPSSHLPGPIGLPWIGNLFQIRQPHNWIQFTKWTDRFGPIYRLRNGRSDLIVLGKPKSAVELLDKRSSKYSSRPRNIMTSEYVSKGLRLTFMPYDPLWRQNRKLLHTLTQPKASIDYEPIQSQESIQLCLDILRTPSDHWNHSQRYAGSTVLQIVFNRRALSNQDEAITKMREINDKMTQTAVPGKHLIDSVPILHHLPHLLSPWKRLGDRLFDQTLDLFAKLYWQAASSTSDPRLGCCLDQDQDRGCFVKRIERSKAAYGLSDHHAIFLAGAMFGAGSDTTADAIETFIFACAANPDKVIKAQEELDRIVGRDRLPEFSDYPHLIYCRAMVRELLRWRPTIPGGLAHMTTEDDVYEGYFIPKGTTVVGNHWSIHRDKETYPEPEKFLPERFIDFNHSPPSLIGTHWSPELGHHAFGFGRRMCPGLHLANRSLFITFTRLLWCFSIDLKKLKIDKDPEESDEAKKDRKEERVKLEEEDYVRFIDSVEFSTGFSSHPILRSSKYLQVHDHHRLPALPLPLPHAHAHARRVPDSPMRYSIEIRARLPSTSQVLTDAYESIGVDPIQL